MSVEKKKSAEQIGALSSCLIEGDSEQKARERKIKRRALAISVVLQSVALVALVLVPLLGKTEKLPNTIFIPIPNYYHGDTTRVEPARPAPPRTHGECIVCFNHALSQHPSMQSNLRQTEMLTGEGPDIGLPGGVPDGMPGMDGFGTRRGPAPPEDPGDRKRRVVRGGDVQQALLIRRVEPVYPRLMQAIRRPGKVELRAIISTDGTIESLQVISGDPGFYSSAMDAVRQWRYKPTLLNGQAVEVETIITVIYSLGLQ